MQQRAFSGVELSASDYEAANKVLAQSQWLSQLYRGQQLVIQTLQAAAMSLERRLEKPLCYRQKSNRKSQAFRNVFQRYYAGRVQPYLAQLKNQQRQAALLLQPLFEPFKNKPAAVWMWIGSLHIVCIHNNYSFMIRWSPVNVWSLICLSLG